MVLSLLIVVVLLVLIPTPSSLHFPSTRHGPSRLLVTGLRAAPIASVSVAGLGSGVNQEAVEQYFEELKLLRGTPELVDRLENLAAKFPGIETNINLYRAIYPFKLDAFQEEGLLSLMQGNNVLVTTPTGSGKTVVGELAIYFALMLGLRVAYTTPLKALSNQKFQDFKAKYGGDRVGLLTGDIAINRGAAITIMTTEVFRNMIYDQDSESQLSNLFMVCFDEFHFMNDPDRGTVWEESVISCPRSVRILALSATMGNVAEIKGWIASIHGPTELVVSTHRPVPLRYMFAVKQGLMPLFRDPNAGPGSTAGVNKVDGKLDPGSMLNPTIIKMEEQAVRSAQSKQASKTGRQFKTAKVNPSTLVARFNDVADELHSLKLLPAIVFIFSRAGCEQSAKLVMQTKTKLLTDDEVKYVQQAINIFSRQNPEIPISRSSVQALRAGVGVHHAGLIPVWKAFIEDLFNANKIKVLFATETLAAGVNMPARTTVIATVTKRINSEVVKLKTSQLLQMAGRAGRRGKDTEGTVVIMRNRFEDARMGHKILVSPVDGIKSHFKTSYGLIVKLLETRTLEACKELIQRGFGAYLLQQKLLKVPVHDELSSVDAFRTVLQKYSLKTSRDYLKAARRLEKEQRNGEFLEQKLLESGSDLVHAIADYMPLGAGLSLRDGTAGFFLGDVRWGGRGDGGGDGGGKAAKFNGFGMITRTGRLLVVRKEHISLFAEPEDCLPISTAQQLLDLLNLTPIWDELLLPGAKQPLLEAATAPADSDAVKADATMAQALYAVQTSQPFPVPAIPGSLVRHREIVAELQAELSQSEIAQNKDGELVLDALRYAAGLRDPMGFINGTPKEQNSRSGEIFAWKMFQAALKVLQQFKALDGTVATDLGQVVASLSADNELWLALVILHPSAQQLTASELAAVLCSIVVDGHKAQGAFFRHQPSDRVKATVSTLESLAWELRAAQTDAGIEFPVNLSGEAGGLVEQWASGVSWRELCRDCSLDQGDLCRILRRTVEALRQIPLAYGVPPALARVAMEAADKMDRFPVADLDSPSRLDDGKEKSTAGVGFGAGIGIAEGEGDVDAAAGLNFMGDDFDGTDDDDEGEIDVAKLGRWKAPGLKGDRSGGVRDLEEEFEGLDLDKLLGLGTSVDLAEVEEVGQLLRGIAEGEDEGEEGEEEGA